MKNIVEAISELRFVANEAQVEALAATVASGSSANGTYLRVLVAHAQRDIAALRKVTKQAVLAVVAGVHERLYLSVLKGVGDESVPMPERQRRATFARTATSALRKFVLRGGDARKLELDTVTKAGLRDYGRRVPTGTRVQRSLQRSAAAVIRAAVRIGRSDPVEARKRLEAVRADIDKALSAIDKAAKTAKREARGSRAVVVVSRSNGHARANGHTGAEVAMH